MPAETSARTFSLPTSIAQPVDVGRLLRELSLIDEHLRQTEIRSPGKAVQVKVSQNMHELLSLNQLNINLVAQRTWLIKTLETIKEHAPVIHISFSSEATPAFTAKIIEWFRKEISPSILIIVGFDPLIGVGSIVRTANHEFDFSLKSRLKNDKELLKSQLHNLAQQKAEQVVQ